MPTKQLFRNLSVSMLFLLIALSNFAYAKTVQNEYFSYVIQCQNSNEVRPRLLDFVESELLRNQSVNAAIINAQSESEILNVLTSDLATHGPLRGQELVRVYNQFKRDMQLSDRIIITPPGETDNLLNLEGCNLIPVAASVQSVDDVTDEVRNSIVIDKKIWDKLFMYEQVAVLLDFALLREIQENNLIPARIFTGYWFSKSLSSMNQLEWLDLTKTLHFPYFEYKNLKINSFAEQVWVKGTLINALLYKNNSLQIGTQTVVISERIQFYPSGNIRSLIFPYIYGPGSVENVYLYPLSESLTLKLNSGGDQVLILYDDPALEIKEASIASGTNTGFYKGHELFFSKNETISFFSPNKVLKIKADKGKLKIQNKIYNVDPLYMSSEIEFYENGSIKCSTGFLENQSFMTTESRTYKTKFTEDLCFDSKGLLIKK